MRVSTMTGASLAAVLITASLGLTACSSSSSSNSTDSAAAAPTAIESIAMDPATVVTADKSCQGVEASGTGYMKNYTTTNSEDWNKFAEEVLGYSNDTTDTTLQGALMNVAVAAQFTVTGLESSEDLTTAKTDFDTTVADLNALCEPAGFPLTVPAGAAAGGASTAASTAPSPSAS